MPSEVWVWAWLPGDTTPTLAGRFRHTQVQSGYRGEFVYGRSYLSNRDALALDPVQLRLVEKGYETTKLQGFFGPLRDAMPDDWGRYVIDRQFGKQPELTGYLLHGSGDHVGNLGFSADREHPPEVHALQTWDSLAKARESVEVLEEGRSIPPAIQDLLGINTNMGGAKPKITVEHQGKQWIAKFPALRERGVPIAKLERAMLELARTCGIQSATAQVVDDILLVERFDRTLGADATGWRRDAFLSAQTVFYSNAAVQEYSFGGSYPRLARELARFSEATSDDREQLFRRMVFNCCISNTDDHDRNHGFLAGDTPGLYRLSPAYDMIPIRMGTKRRYQAMDIGERGAAPSKENILSDCASFGLSRVQASLIMDEVQGAVQANWKPTICAEGLTESQAEEWSICFDLLPD